MVLSYDSESYDSKTKPEEEERKEEEEEVPFQEKQKPFQEKPEPFQEKQKPFQKKPEPFQKERKPFPKEVPKKEPGYTLQAGSQSLADFENEVVLKKNANYYDKFCEISLAFAKSLLDVAEKARAAADADKNYKTGLLSDIKVPADAEYYHP